MCLKVQELPAIPEETVRVARKAFPKGNVYMKMRDEFGTFYTDSEFSHLFAVQGQPGLSPAMLNLVMVMQYAEGLADRQAADAVRARIDWKYALGLDLRDAGFDYTVLSEHRDRLIAGGMECQLLDQMLDLFKERELIKSRGAQRTDSTHVLASTRDLNRLEMVGETIRLALNQCAEVAPGWLREQVTPDWFDRYSHRFEQYRLPKSPSERKALAEVIGTDGYHLLRAVDSASAPERLRQTPGVEIMRQVWAQQFEQDEGQVRWREAGTLPPTAEVIQSPHDPEACYGTKRSLSWTGYKVHWSETCDPDQPHLITHVETSKATKPDCKATQVIHADLAQKELLPSEHLVDAGYVDAEILVSSRTEHDIEVISPIPKDRSWQAQAGEGYDVSCFIIDWESQKVTCPQGQTSTVWSTSHDLYENEVIHVRFAPKDCRPCSHRCQCTRSEKNPRSLKLRPKEQHLVLQTIRQYQKTDEFKQRYVVRAGVEGTVSQATRLGLRRSRYVGLAKTHLQNVATAAAINLTRIVAWLEGRLLAPTRISRFAALAPG